MVFKNTIVCLFLASFLLQSNGLSLQTNHETEITTTIGPFGGSGGVPFEYIPRGESCDLKTLQVRQGVVVNGLRAIFDC